MFQKVVYHCGYIFDPNIRLEKFLLSRVSPKNELPLDNVFNLNPVIPNESVLDGPAENEGAIPVNCYIPNQM